MKSTHKDEASQSNDSESQESVETKYDFEGDAIADDDPIVCVGYTLTHNVGNFPTTAHKVVHYFNKL